MTSKTHWLSLLIVVTMVAAGLRFYRLGNWSFEADEIGALVEEQIHFYGADFADDEHYNYQHTRLPRIVPLGYGVLHVGYELFGRDEAGSRVAPAIIGTATAALVFLLMAPVSGRAAALATSLLIAFSQQHVYYSQFNRFYVVAVFCGYLCFLVGAYGVRDLRPLVALLLCAGGAAALFAHPMAAGAFGLACLGILAGTIADRRRVRRSGLLVLVAGALALAAIIAFHVLPLLRGWNQGLETGDTPAVALLATISRIGWPVVWLAALGGLLAVLDGGGANCYWLVCALGSWAVIFLMPMEFVFVARYALPLSLPVFVLAGTAIAKVFRLLRERSLPAAIAWMALAALIGLPSLASHYLDGSRADLRSAVEYVQRHWREGDRVCCASLGTKLAFAHYGPECRPQQILAAGQSLEQMVAGGGRTWIVSCSYWGGRSSVADDWLGKKCLREARFEKPRYDHYRYCADVYLYDPDRRAGTSGVAAAHASETE
jgi:hypothetical protein